MSSHRRFVASEASEAYAPTGEYGFFSIATNVADEFKSPSVSGWIDYLIGGYEQEDLAATPDTACGTIHGEPVEGCAQYIIEQRNAERLRDGPDWFKPDDPNLLPDKDIPWDKIALATGIVVGGFFVYDKFIRPRFSKAESGRATNVEASS